MKLAGRKAMSKKMIKCEINKKKLEVQEGTSIITAFKQLGQDICHYCWHPGLSTAGVCRLCMVDIEGMKDLQIACNTKIQEGMIISNQTEKVKTAVRWGLEYHLINHPLDCPICDQAGECALQEQYMKFGSYDSSMAEAKVKKRKVVDLGSKIVLDTERCILCSRCVRFTDEVTKTHELGIFNRGDRSEIGVFEDKPLKNDYAVNTVDICPVGALTSKDFRFQQRVWYVKTAPSICNGCSTGCNIYVDYNEEGIWRVRPRWNEKINGHWMCDKGRGLYKNTKQKIRLAGLLSGEDSHWRFLKNSEAFPKIKELIQENPPAFILTGQYTNEEYKTLLDFFPKSLFYHWLNNEKTFDDFDGLLLRGDKNPNTKGLKKIFPKIKPLKDLTKNISTIKTLIVLGPEHPNFYLDIEEKTKLFSQVENLLWFSLVENPFLKPKPGKNIFQIPIKSFFEKEGTYLNYKGLKQKIHKIQILNSQALSIQDFVNGLEEESVKHEREHPYFKQNQFLDRKSKVW